MTTLDVCKRDFECLIKRIEVEDSLGDTLNCTYVHVCMCACVYMSICSCEHVCMCVC